MRSFRNTEREPAPTREQVDDADSRLTGLVVGSAVRMEEASVGSTDPTDLHGPIVRGSGLDVGNTEVSLR